MSSRLRSRLRASTSLSGGPAAALDLNFITGSYQTGGGSYAFQDLIRFSRTSAGTFTGSNGLIQNSPISNNLLLWTEEFENAAWTKVAAAVQSNLLLRSQEYDNASWIKNTAFVSTNLLRYSEELDNPTTWVDTLSGTGLATTVTPNAGVAPDGSTTADRVQLNLGGGTTLSDYVRRRQSYVTPVGQYTYSIYLKSFDGVSTYDMHVVAPNGQTITIVVTPTWQRFTVTANGLNVGVTYGLGLRGGLTPANSNTADVLAWGAQLVQGSVPGDYQRTEAAALAVSYTAPDGTLTADKLVVEDAAPFSSSYIRQNISKGATPLRYTSSVYAKAGELNQVRIVVRDSSTSANGAGVAVSLVDGSIVTAPYVVGTFTSPSAVVTDAGSGWYRIALTFTTGTETAIWAQTVFPQDSVVTTGDGASGIYVWGSQLVNGPVAETYQPTAASAIAIQHLAPNGVLSANKIVENGSSAYHYARELVTVANGAYTFTVYLKAGERSRAIVSMSDNTTGYAFVGVDLTDGTTFTPTALSVGSWTAVSSSVTPVGGGWYRVRVTGTANAGTQIAGTLFSTDGTSATFLGDGSSGFYAWGAQLEVGSSETAYSRNADGLYAPRFDYDPVTLEAKGLLIEEQRANLVTYSEQFVDASWTKTNLTVTADATTSPDGATTADKLIATSSANVHETVKALTGLTASTTYTISVYLKAAEQTWAYVNFLYPTVSDYRTFFNLANGTIGTNPAGSTATITPVGNGWYRCTVTRTTAAGQTNVSVVVAGTTANNTTIYAGNGTNGIFAWGAQFELGASATAYIPTVGTVTRAPDSALTLGPAFSSFYNQNEGTFVVELDMSVATGRWIVSASDGTTSNVVGMNTSSGGGPRASITYAGTGQSSVGASFVVTPNQLVKLGMAYSATSTVVAANGTLSVEDTSAMIPTVSQLQLFANGAAAAVGNGHIRRVRYYNTRLTDAQLQALTT